MNLWTFQQVLPQLKGDKSHKFILSFNQTQLSFSCCSGVWIILVFNCPCVLILSWTLKWVLEFSVCELEFKPSKFGKVFNILFGTKYIQPTKMDMLRGPY